MLIKLFSLGVTAEALRVNIAGKWAFLKGVGQFRVLVNVCFGQCVFWSMCVLVSFGQIFT